MAVPDVNQKAEIYETLASLNMAFAGIVQHLRTLHETGLFRSKASKQFPGFALELQAEFNQEFLETLEAIELEDWNRFGIKALGSQCPIERLHIGIVDRLTWPRKVDLQPDCDTPINPSLDW